jgi:hypothetical protein
MSQRPLVSREACQTKANEKEHSPNLILALQRQNKKGTKQLINMSSHTKIRLYGSCRLMPKNVNSMQRRVLYK